MHVHGQSPLSPATFLLIPYATSLPCPSVRYRTFSLLFPPVLLAACGGGSTPLTPLTHTAASSLANDASNWLQSGPYHFSETLLQTSDGSNITGLDAAGLAEAISSLSATATGDVTSSTRSDTAATVKGVPSTVDLFINGCTGYASLGGGNWASGSNELALANDFSPQSGGAFQNLTWTQVGTPTVNGQQTYELRSQITQAQVDSRDGTGSGITIEPGSDVTLWISSRTHHLVRLTDGSNVTFNLSVIAAQAEAIATGTEKVTTSLTINFSSPADAVTVPKAQLSSDPVPPSVLDGFGLFASNGPNDCLSSGTLPATSAGPTG